MGTFAESTMETVEEFADGAGQPAPGEPEGEIGRLALHDDGPGVQPRDPDALDLHVSQLVDGLLDGSLEEIDGLIAALEALRDQVDADARRVRSELSILSRVGESAMQTTTALGEALGTWRRAARTE